MRIIKESYEVKRDLLKYLREIEQNIKQNKPVDRFSEGRMCGILDAIDFIDGDLYYSSDGQLLNKV